MRCQRPIQAASTAKYFHLALSITQLDVSMSSEQVRGVWLCARRLHVEIRFFGARARPDFAFCAPTLLVGERRRSVGGGGDRRWTASGDGCMVSDKVEWRCDMWPQSCDKTANQHKFACMIMMTSRCEHSNNRWLMVERQQAEVLASVQTEINVNCCYSRPRVD